MESKQKKQKAGQKTKNTLTDLEPEEKGQEKLYRTSSLN